MNPKRKIKYWATAFIVVAFVSVKSNMQTEDPSFTIGATFPKPEPGREAWGYHFDGEGYRYRSEYPKSRNKIITYQGKLQDKDSLVTREELNYAINKAIEEIDIEEAMDYMGD